MSRSQKGLTFEQTRGTKTYHLPFERNAEVQPEATIMVRRLEDGSFIAGVSVRSLEEPFVKREGRLRAYKRLLHAGHGRGAFLAPVAEQLALQVQNMFDRINEHHAGTVSAIAWQDLEFMAGGLEEAFDRLAKNRERSEPRTATRRVAQARR